MALFTVEGSVENGQIRLRDQVMLPEQTRVYVVIPTVETTPQAHLFSPHLVHYESKRPTESCKAQRKKGEDSAR